MADKAFIKRIGYDTLLNIVSYGLPILMLQFVVFPYIANSWGTIEYGVKKITIENSKENYCKSKTK